MKDQEIMVFDKACDITASALRGAMGGENSQPPSFAADVFKEILKALQEALDEMPDKQKAGF